MRQPLPAEGRRAALLSHSDKAEGIDGVGYSGKGM
jgi:hypothetical protein